ncbi:MAG: Phenylacetic acid catabolic protein, partial [Chitinophagaceae bacterium]
GEWVIRLGDGTEEGNQRIKNALADLWMFTGEMFMPFDYEQVDVSLLKNDWMKKVEAVFAEAILPLPAGDSWMQGGGKEGRHTEHLGYLSFLLLI